MPLPRVVEAPRNAVVSCCGLRVKRLITQQRGSRGHDGRAERVYHRGMIPTSPRVPGILPAGEPAPEFELPAGPDGQTLSLKQLRGENVILVFYPADFSPVCGDQVTLYNEILPEFEALRARTLGISVDSAWCHQAYAESRRLKFPLLSDFHPKGAVAQRYGAYDNAWGVAVRALFVIDGAGIIRWSYLSPIDVNPGANGILAALEEIEGKRVEVP